MEEPDVGGDAAAAAATELSSPWGASTLGALLTSLLALALGWAAWRYLRRDPTTHDASASAARRRRGEGEEEPSWLLCPITQAIFRDPVFVVDSGNTYDRSAVLGYWARVGEARDPLTNVRLGSREIRTNWDVRRNVQAFLDKHPTQHPEGWDSREMLPPDRPEQDPPRALQEGGEGQDEGAAARLPPGAHAHCAAIAQAHGGRLPEAHLAHLANCFGVNAETLRQAFPEPREELAQEAAPAAAHAAANGPAAGAAAPAGGEAAAQEVPPLDIPAAARAHCDAVAQAHGGRLPDELLPHLARVFGLEEAGLRAAYGGAVG